jgi:hypothetical protein
MKFYQINQPTTKQIFDAIINNEYVPIEKMQSKAKQVKVLLQNYFNSDDIYITFSSVTNCGGVPIFLGGDFCLYEVAQNSLNLDSDDDIDEAVELLGCYLRDYESIFNLN